MKDAERYFARLHKRLRLELGKKKANEIVEELDSHYRAKLIELRELGITFAEASKSAIEALGPINAIVEDYTQPAGWMNLKPIEKRAIWIPTIGLLAMVFGLAAIDLFLDRGRMYYAQRALLPVLTLLCLPLIRTGFLSARLIPKQAMLGSLLAIIIPVAAASMLCYVQVDGNSLSLLQFKKLRRDEAAYLKKLKGIETELQQGKAAFANARANYVTAQYDVMRNILEVDGATLNRTVHGGDIAYVARELAEAEQSMRRYRHGPSIDPYRTRYGFKVVRYLDTEPCRIYDAGANSYSRYGAVSTRVSGIAYHEESSLCTATRDWQNGIYLDTVKDELPQHTEALAALEPIVNQPLTKRWPESALVFGDVVGSSYIHMLLMNLFGAIAGILWRAAGKQYNRLIRS